jgi:DNA repair protein RecN (Recombination protein N)
VNLADFRKKANIEVIDQNSAQTLLEQHKEMLDAFAGIEKEVDLLNRSLLQEKEMEEKLQILLQTPRERELKWAQKDLNFLEEVNVQKGEEELLAQEHVRLASSQELSQKIQLIHFVLREENHLAALKRALNTLESCARVDQALQATADSFKSALLELEEAALVIERYHIEANPERLAEIEKRIADIEALKKRFGLNFAEQKERLLKTIDHLSHLEEEIELLKKACETKRKENSAACQAITLKRKEKAPLFASRILKELKSLNIPHAKVEIEVGAPFNEVSFLFSANPGIQPMPIASCASGGELSRLFLAMKTVLFSGTSTLVFDEIDSNVGGQTALVLGEKLKALSQNRQVICVTHFVQVAKQALDHFYVSKKEKNNLAYTEIKKLSEKEREEEYHRMVGS